VAGVPDTVTVFRSSGHIERAEWEYRIDPTTTQTDTTWHASVATNPDWGVTLRLSRTVTACPNMDAATTGVTMEMSREELLALAAAVADLAARLEERATAPGGFDVWDAGVPA
jgi:hypothetical protein